MKDYSKQNNERIVKNTLTLYVRTALVMLVSLFTSRVVLSALGIEDYGIYNIVGGVVVMFSVVSGALSASISRFITFELGRADMRKLRRIFSTSINIQVGISLLILILGETVGIWFLNYKMNIPLDRLEAANWVLQCSLITFVINLVSVPYNAVIIAHEKMSAFAYVSILEVILKLLIAYLLYISIWDKLVVYSLLLVLVAMTIRIVYGVYCNRHFFETRYQLVFDRTLIRDMTSFAGWGFFTNTAYLFNTQGINILINMFFGVGVNAACGIATQVESAMMRFVNDFTTALNPQITKSYAIGNFDVMNKLVIRGAKFSYFLLFALSLPILLETHYILDFWLGKVPEHTVTFIRLVTIGTMIDRLGNTGYTACMATGTIRRYVLWITSIGCLVFPITWLTFKLGAPVETAYIVFACVYVGVDIVRLWIMKKLLNFPVGEFVREVVGRIIIVSIMAVFFPFIIILFFDQSFARLVISTVVSVLSVSISIYLFGVTTNERIKITTKIVSIIKSRLHY